MAEPYPLNSTSPSAMPAASKTQVAAQVAAQSTQMKRRHIVLILAAIGVLFLALTPNLVLFPVTWFDEGSHLHVPKTLVTYGVYADYSSEGFRYYGPTIGVGPTVMLPIAAVFSLFGIGLLQARLVMVFYLATSIVLFYVLARRLGSTRFALVATGLLLTAPSVSLIEYGRQVLGEVPALVFLLLGLLAWQPAFAAANPANLLGRTRGGLQLLFVGLMFGLTTITKNQFLLVLAPSLVLAWLVCAVFLRLRRRQMAQLLRALPHRLFLVPLITLLACYGVWQLYIVLSLGPSTVQENFRTLRDATAGAAFVFSLDAMERAGRELLSRRAYGHVLVPALVYAGLLMLRLFKRPSPKAVAPSALSSAPLSPAPLSPAPLAFDGQAHFWLVLLIFIGVNLVWYVIASIGWVRYAFPGLVLAALFVARLLFDLKRGFVWRWPWQGTPTALHPGPVSARLKPVLKALVVGVVILNTAYSGLFLLRNVVVPPRPAAQTMAAYLDQHVPLDAPIETWEPEMGFLTNHRYHFPPNALLSKSVNHKFSQGPAPSLLYNFMAQTPGARPPAYVLVGDFGRWVDVYPKATLSQHYQKVAAFDDYELYALVR